MSHGTAGRGSPADSGIAEMAERYRRFADAEGAHAPVYGAAARAMAGQERWCRLLLAAPRGQRRPVLALAAMHDLLLQHPDEPLARWFATTAPAGGAVGVTAASLADDRLAIELGEFVERFDQMLLERVRHRTVQTNEVNRATAWWVGLDHLRRGGLAEVALVELGASAGLNLQLDRFRGTIHTNEEPLRFGPPDAPVHLGCEAIGPPPPPPTLPKIAGRVGIDLHPLDPTQPADARWLTACVWPEQTERHRRLEAALLEARHHPVPVRTGDLIDDLPDAIDQLPHGVPVVALMSWVITYLPRDRRAAVIEALAAAEVTALVALEAPGTLPGITTPALDPSADAERRSASLLSITTPGNGAGRVLARCHPHLTWMEWFADPR